MYNSIKKSGDRIDAYQLVTDQIIARLEQGQIPWKMPWARNGLACNFSTLKAYRGINAILLNGLFESRYFLTMKQANDKGGRIKKGSKSMVVCFWNRTYTIKGSGQKITPEQAAALPADMLDIKGFLKTYRVFNAEQIEGIDFPKGRPAIISEENRLQNCEKVVEEMPLKPTIRHQGQEAYYAPGSDTVTMPDLDRFYNTEGYYQTLFHELAHSTGHSSRLNRPGITVPNKYGSEDYSFEELVAELTASYITNDLGLQSEPIIENSAGYIQSWIKVLLDDKTMIVRAAGYAQKAADWILKKELETA